MSLDDGMAREEGLPQTLFVEGLKMRPTAAKVLFALADLDGEPTMFPKGNTTEELANHTGLSKHQVRARLCDLRRLKLVNSTELSVDGSPRRHSPKRYAHHLTVEGYRRSKIR